MRALVLSGMALIAVSYGLARFGYGLFLPQMTAEIVLSSTASGLVQAGSFLSYCLAAALATAQPDRPRLLVWLAGGVAAVGAALVAVAPGAAALALGVVIAGAGAGFATPGLVALIQLSIATARREGAQTIVNAGTGAGIVVAALLLLVLGEQWRLAWAIIALLAIVATLAVLRSAPRPAAPDPSRVRPARFRIRHLAPLGAPILAALLAGAGSAAVWTFGGSAIEQGDGPVVVAWMALGALGMLGAAAAALVQRWSLRVGWALTSAAMAISTALLGLLPGLPAVAIPAAALFGASYTALSGVLIVWAVRVDAANAARGTIVLFIALALGQAAGAPVVGAVIDASSTALAFGLAAAVGVLSQLPAMRGERPRARAEVS